jgi:hypothetical protein
VAMAALGVRAEAVARVGAVEAAVPVRAAVRAERQGAMAAAAVAAPRFPPVWMALSEVPTSRAAARKAIGGHRGFLSTSTIVFSTTAYRT